MPYDSRLGAALSDSILALLPTNGLDGSIFVTKGYNMVFVYILSGSIAIASSLGQAQENRKFDPLWSECKRDSDCVLIEGLCSAFRGVNKIYEQNAKKYFHWANAAASCVQLDSQKVVKPKVTCLKETCETK